MPGAWPLRRDTWLAETRADRAVRARLLATAGEWERARRDPSYLYSGTRLEIAVQAAARIGADTRQVPPGAAEEGFLDASRQAARRRRRRGQGFLAVLLALVAGLTAAAAVDLHANNATAAQRDIAESAVSEELASDSEGLGAASPANAPAAQLESIDAWGVSPLPRLTT